MPRALISGASVTGPALACWLGRAGWDVLVVERAQALRDAGQNVDVRGAGREVARRLGVEDAIRAANTTEEGTVFVDADGHEVSSFDATTDDSPTAELEILRGQLSRILVEASGDRAEYVFGDHIEAIEDRGDGARVRLASGREEDVDVVAVAEGQRSSTRELRFDDVELRPLGVDIAYLTIPRVADDTRTWRWYTAPGSRQVMLRPDNVGTTRAMLAFQPDGEGYGTAERDEQLAVLRERFADAGWQSQRILDGLEDGDLYYESLAQVRAPRWSDGPVVLVGDAAHCVTPLGGLGTSLGLVGAYLLAGELATAPDRATAFANYEDRLRPFAEKRQDLPPGVPDLAYPQTAVGVRMLRLATKAAASRAGQAVAALVPSGNDDVELPDYAFRA